MATNSELQSQLIAAQKEIQTLRDEFRVLKEVLDRTFRNAGLTSDWCQARAMTRAPAPAEVTPHEAVPAPTSVSGVIRGMVREFFPDGPPTVDQLKKLIESKE